MADIMILDLGIGIISALFLQVQEELLHNLGHSVIDSPDRVMQKMYLVHLESVRDQVLVSV